MCLIYWFHMTQIKMATESLRYRSTAPINALRPIQSVGQVADDMIEFVLMYRNSCSLQSVPKRQINFVTQACATLPQ